jgi:hypothetical protein
MYNEPDWSSLTVTELLEKAQAFGEKAYANALSTYAFLGHALEASSKRSTATMEIAELIERTKQAYDLLAGVNRDIARFVPPNPATSPKERE